MDYPVVILCGGRGMRLNERTESIPKPMVEIGKMPILWHIMKIYAASGLRRFILCLGYKGEQIREFFVEHLWRTLDCTLRLRGANASIDYHQDGSSDWEITFVDTGLDTETGGRLTKIASYIDTPTFCVTYGDGVSDLSVDALLRRHSQLGCVGTMTCVRPQTHYGSVDRIEQALVTEYHEKQRLGTFVNGGFFCFQREMFSYIHGNEALEKEPLQRLVANRQLAGFGHDGFWACMDHAKDHQNLNDLWQQGRAPWKVWQ